MRKLSGNEVTYKKLTQLTYIIQCVFSLLMRLNNHHDYLIWKYFFTPRRNPITVISHFPFPSPWKLIFLFYGFVYSTRFYKWNYTTCDLLKVTFSVGMFLRFISFIAK
jgi:hypothetical protein